MEALTIDVISIETIKPSQSSLQDHGNLQNQPFKLCLLDQTIPPIYLPIVLFYPNDQNDPTFSIRLKSTLSRALARYYPFSGRLKDDNLFVHDFHVGVPFKEARVNCQLSDFLNNRSRTIMSHLNKFLPRKPICNEKSNPDMPQLAVQLTRFACGGIAIGACFSHKVADETTCVAFLDVWAAFTRGEAGGDHELDLRGASSRFPAVDSLPPLYESAHEKIGNCKTERFVFDEEALAALKAKARNDVVPNPSRVLALSSFIWNSVITARGTVLSDSCPKTHVLLEAVNIRERRPNNVNNGPTKTTVTGNLFWVAAAVYKDRDCATNYEKPELVDLVKLADKSRSEVNNDRMRSIRGNEALNLVMARVKMMEELKDSETLTISSWVNMGYKDIDFGLGKPVWVGAFGGGEGGPEFSNFVVLVDATWCKGIEAWVTIDEKVMEVLKSDPDFLAYAAVDPSVPSKIK